MAGFIQDILWNSVEGFVDAAKKTGGEYAGNALIKAGDLIEGGGRSVGGGMYFPAWQRQHVRRVGGRDQIADDRRG